MSEEVVTLNPPLSDEKLSELKVGDLVKITGTIVTARDEAYEKILKITNSGEDLPTDLEGGVIYHCGPIAKQENNEWKIIAAGPTTSARLDDMQAEFVENTGVKALIGKGGVGEKVGEEISELGCVYLSFTGGAAALAADAITSVEDIFWSDLGIPEALWVLKVEEFGPLLVSVNLEGKNLYTKE
ncbi:fumarate hydratase [candidate division MSBL1 archaeon SCGC-AAA382F02]|uniref:Fumarate hydratase n=1 Tax=candidate division MSBL1 archaeon SCGC-AAA382F02 TaxID=1698282 RepID=A0A133VJ37_9EURY|nr:fumarate hydratase [candidate division MSBL1 archaeon SCGC-AAA382F02]